MRAMFRAIVATAVLACPLYASAVPVTFDLAGAPVSSVQVVDFDGGFLCNLSGCGIDTTLNSALGSLNRSLNVGESWIFDFFDIDFYGLGGGTGTIQASLGFDSPSGRPTAGGTGTGGFATFFGLITGGSLTWTTPASTFTLANGTQYSVAFENLSGLTVGSTTVNGRITLLQGPGSVSVPEPATLTLLGIGLLGLGLARRRRTSA
jgi:hypothetical protein